MIEKTFGRSPLVVPAEPPRQAPHAALLVDFDNVTMGIRSDLQTQLRKLLNSAIIRGKVSVQRAYADWRRYPQYIVPLTEASIDLIFAPAVGANKKNATDIRLAIDALELVFTRPEIGTFILLSGDSDFSALVLKLKEYGKFVIGVGIRESSSDLLVQNCDEYYSYNELTGLARTGDTEIVRHDPWELAVEAVQKMMRNGDVMRSDRLKQVMQSIDPSFDEKDAGCNRFSKFVLEAEKRGLLRLTKMENGQHAVDIGPNANVRIEHGTSADTKTAKPEAAPSSSVQRRKRTTRSRGGQREAKTRTLTLSESLDLLKGALVVAGALGNEATVADRARERMIEIHGSDSDPIFEPSRFQRLLRQAHDADVIELIKSGGDDYMLKLSPAAAAKMESDKAVVVPEEAAGEDANATPKPPQTAKKRSATARKSTRSRAGAAAKEVPDEATAASADAEEKPTGVEVEKPKSTSRRKATTRKKTARSRVTKSKEDAPDEVGADAPLVSEEKIKTEATPRPEKTKEGGKVAAGAPKLNPRYRLGSRAVTPKPQGKDEPAESDAKAPEVAASTPKVSTAPRTLGVRSGSRGAKRPEKEPLNEPKVDKEAPKLPKEEPPRPRLEELKAPKEEPQPAMEKPKPKAEPEPVAKAERSTGEPVEDGAGLFRKVTAAFQRALGAGKEDTE